MANKNICLTNLNNECYVICEESCCFEVLGFAVRALHILRVSRFHNTVIITSELGNVCTN